MNTERSNICIYFDISVNYKFHFGLIYMISSKEELLENLIIRSPLVTVKNAVIVDCNLMMTGLEVKRKEGTAAGEHGPLFHI